MTLLLDFLESLRFLNVNATTSVSAVFPRWSWWVAAWLGCLLRTKWWSLEDRNFFRRIIHIIYHDIIHIYIWYVCNISIYIIYSIYNIEYKYYICTVYIYMYLLMIPFSGILNSWLWKKTLLVETNLPSPYVAESSYIIYLRAMIINIYI